MPFPYAWRALTPSQDREIARALERGVSPDALAVAYGIGRRTVYRAARRANEPALVVEVGPYHATFVVTDGGPVQVEPWRARATEESTR